MYILVFGCGKTLYWVRQLVKVLKTMEILSKLCCAKWSGLWKGSKNNLNVLGKTEINIHG